MTISNMLLYASVRSPGIEITSFFFLRADHWDVMNELEHGQWFEEQFHDPDYSEHLFTRVHQLDPRPLLMLNDFSVIARAEITDVSVCLH